MNRTKTTRRRFLLWPAGLLLPASALADSNRRRRVLLFLATALTGSRRRRD